MKEQPKITEILKKDGSHFITVDGKAVASIPEVHGATDTFGSTSVSTPHNACDQYALRDVLSFMRLYELTGNAQWRERALAFWCNATQGISDGTLVINDRLRPAGSQDEAIAHTRWGAQLHPCIQPHSMALRLAVCLPT